MDSKKREIVLYIFFGVLTTIVSIVTYFIFHSMFGESKIATQIATILSWIFAVSFAFVTNKIWVFNSKSLEMNVVLKEGISFCSARLFSLMFELVFMTITVDICFKFFENFYLLERISEMFGFQYFDFYQLLAKLTANFFVMVMNYVFSKLFIFKEKNTIKGECQSE